HHDAPPSTPPIHAPRPHLPKNTGHVLKKTAGLMGKLAAKSLKAMGRGAEKGRVGGFAGGRFGEVAAWALSARRLRAAVGWVVARSSSSLRCAGRAGAGSPRRGFIACSIYAHSTLIQSLHRER